MAFVKIKDVDAPEITSVTCSPELDILNTKRFESSTLAAKNLEIADALKTLAHPLQVQVFRLLALPGVRFKYAESDELNRRLRLTW